MLDNKGHKPEHNVEQKAGQAPPTGDAALSKFPEEAIGGRTLWAISQQYNITLKALYQANKDQFQAIVEDPKGTVFPPKYYKEQVIRIPDTASVPGLEAQFNLEHEHKGRGTYARKGDKRVADKGKEHATEDKAAKIVQDLAAVEKQKQEAAQKAADEQRRQAAEKIEAAHKASAIGELRKELKDQQDIHRQLNKDYINELKKNSGGLGITAETVQTTLGASANSSNPVEAFLGQHLINKDLNLDATEKIIDTTMADSVQKINKVQRDIRHFEHDKSPNWHTELNQTRKTIYQLMANAETINQAIGNFAEAKTGTKDAIADGVSITGGALATAVPVPGFNLAVGASLKTAIKGGDALSTGSEYTLSDGLTDGATGALDACAIGKGLQAGNAASVMAMKAGLRKAGFQLAGKGVARHFVAEETASVGKKVLATGATLLIKDGTVGGSTAFIRSAVRHTAGGISDVSRGKDPEIGKRAADVARDTADGYGTAAVIGLGSRVTGEGVRLGVDNTTRVAKNVSARLYKPTDSLYSSSTVTGGGNDFTGIDKPNTSGENTGGVAGTDKTSGVDKSSGAGGVDKTTTSGVDKTTTGGADKTTTSGVDKTTTSGVDKTTTGGADKATTGGADKTTDENPMRDYDLSNASAEQRARYQQFQAAAEKNGIKAFPSTRYNGDIEVKYGKSGQIHTMLIDKQGKIKIEQLSLANKSPYVRYTKIDTDGSKVIQEATLDASGKRVSRTSESSPKTETKPNDKQN